MPPKWVEGMPLGVEPEDTVDLSRVYPGGLIEALEAHGYIAIHVSRLIGYESPKASETPDDSDLLVHTRDVMAGYGLRSGLHKDRGYDLLP